MFEFRGALKAGDSRATFSGTPLHERKSLSKRAAGCVCSVNVVVRAAGLLKRHLSVDTPAMRWLVHPAGGVESDAVLKSSCSNILVRMLFGKGIRFAIEFFGTSDGCSTGTSFRCASDDEVSSRIEMMMKRIGRVPK